MIDRRTFLLSSVAIAAAPYLHGYGYTPLGPIGPVGPLCDIAMDTASAEGFVGIACSGSIGAKGLTSDEAKCLEEAKMTDQKRREALNEVTDQLEKLRAAIEVIDDEDAMDALEDFEKALRQLMTALTGEASGPETA